jgi:transposase
MTDEALEARLFPASMALAAIKARRPQPDWRTIHRELRRKGVTLQLLWEEHRAAHSNGYGSSRFCDLYRAREARLSYAADPGGDQRPDRRSVTAQLFVAALGASSIQLHLCRGNLHAFT